MTRKSWVYVNGKAYEKGTEPSSDPTAPLIFGDIEPFVSPITGEVIRGRGHLRSHMKEHGVTHADDYSPEYYAKKQHENYLKATGQTREARMERIELIKRALEK